MMLAGRGKKEEKSLTISKTACPEFFSLPESYLKLSFSIISYATR